MTPDELITKRLLVRRRIEEIKERHKVELAPLAQAEGLLDGALLSVLDEQGLTQIKGQDGTAFTKISMSVKTSDREALFEYVREHDAFDMLTAAVSKDAVREYIDANGGNPPPGVDIAMVRVVQIRSA